MTTPDVPHRFELTLEVPGTADDVWHAIATADGITAWMMPTELEPREGGAVTFHMGPGDESRGRVTAYEPGRRFAYEEDWAALVGQTGAPVTPLATEFLVEARSGGTCVVRVVTSAFGTGAEWEQEFWEEMATGWAPMLDNLRLYLTHFPGQRAATFSAGTTFPLGPVDAVALVRDRLGAARAGNAIDARGVRGVVERVVDRHFLVRLEEPVAGFVNFWSFPTEAGSGVNLLAYLFGDGAPAYAASEQPAWQEWIDAAAAGVAAERAARA
jgi:uncharacterized protein YndB with AHSA1/START domain